MTGRRAALGGALLAAGVLAAFAAGWPGDWCLGRVRAALERSDLSSAVRWLDRAGALPHDGAEFAFQSARVERKLGRLQNSGEALNRASDLGYDRKAIEFEARLAAAQGGALTDPQAALARMLAAGEQPREVAEAFVRGAILSYRLDDAMGLIDVWRKDFPHDPEPHYLAGRIFEHRADTGSAEAELRAALRVAPHHAPSAYNLGRILLSARRPDEALTQYEACAANLYESLPAILGAAQCLREMGRLADARGVLSRAAVPPPERLEIAYCVVGDAAEGAAARLDEEWGRLASAERNWAEAERRFAAALEKFPRAWRVRYAYATALRQQGKPKEAAEQLRLYDEAKKALDDTDRLVDRLRTDPADVEARYQLGTVFLKYVSENQGLAWLNSALTYQPDHRPSHRALAEYYASKADESPQFARLAERHRALSEQPGPPPPSAP